VTKTRFAPSVLFENQPIRRVYDEATETWWFSVVDIVRILTQQPDATVARKYWNKLKQRLRDEGSELVTHCHQLKLTAEDGKQRLTDVAIAETLLRMVQSVPSPKAEPIKLWLAKVGYERMQEIADPALGLERTRENWRKPGRSEKWITQRMTGQETRNKLTDYWATHEVKQGREFAILTILIHEEWSGISVKNHKNLKGLEGQNLRDHMSEAELIFTALAELSTRQIAETNAAVGLPANNKDRRQDRPARTSRTRKQDWPQGRHRRELPVAGEGEKDAQALREKYMPYRTPGFQSMTWVTLFSESRVNGPAI
jgi:DNA-damage-inducible protein D